MIIRFVNLIALVNPNLEIESQIFTKQKRNQINK
jgi:hypothetical protein